LSVDKLVVCAEWDLTRPAIPSRSRLYSLEPIGIGTSETESLTSYVGRLAEAHSVRVHDLVVHELLPFLGRPHLADGRNASLLTAFWRNETRALNGTRTLARNLVQALEALTGQRNLRFLTLLSWTEVLPVHQLQKPSRAWCPICFEEWRQDGRAAYDPLVWTLAPVTFCPKHLRPLLVACPFPGLQTAIALAQCSIKAGLLRPMRTLAGQLGNSWSDRERDGCAGPKGPGPGLDLPRSRRIDRLRTPHY